MPRTGSCGTVPGAGNAGAGATWRLALVPPGEGAICCIPILAAMPVINAGAREALEALRARGLRLGLICNTGRTPGRMLRLVLARLGLARYLDVLSFSDEVGLRKPHHGIFLRTLSAMDVAPAEAAHVGDDGTTSSLHTLPGVVFSARG